MVRFSLPFLPVRVLREGNSAGANQSTEDLAMASCGAEGWMEPSLGKREDVALNG
jgi:hypothetical protein